jgi:hypothetical protein
MEEAGVLEVLFTGVEDADQVTHRLDMYETVMKRHIHVTHLLSEAQTGAENDAMRKKAEIAWGEALYPATSINFSQPIRNFFFKRDLPAEAHEYIKSL